MRSLFAILFLTLVACGGTQEGDADLKAKELELKEKELELKEKELELEKSGVSQEDENPNYEEQLIGVWQTEIVSKSSGMDTTASTSSYTQKVMMELKENNIAIIKGEEAKWKVDEEGKVLTLVNPKKGRDENLDIVAIKKDEFVVGFKEGGEYINMTWKRF